MLCAIVAAVVAVSAPPCPEPPAPVEAAEATTQPVEATAEPTEAPEVSAVLEAIAQCESGGDPDAVSPSGRHRGKYQFDRQTWRSVGGAGDPADAPEAEQDRRAQILYRRRGGQPWPNCP